VVELHSSFGVPHAESGNEVALGQDYHRSMCAQFSRGNEKELIVGWYATTLEGGKTLNSNSIIIHGFYAANSDASARLVHLVVDTSLAQGKAPVAIKAYVSTAVNIGGAPVANVFHQVKVDVVASAPERVCLDRMIRGQDPASAWAQPETRAVVRPSAEGSREDLEASVARLLGMLEEVADFVDRVVEGKEAGDSAVGCQIADALSTVPRVRPELFDSTFSGGLQDLLMVSYLSTLTKANLAVAEKLSGLKNK